MAAAPAVDIDSVHFDLPNEVENEGEDLAEVELFEQGINDRWLQKRINDFINQKLHGDVRKNTLFNNNTNDCRGKSRKKRTVVGNNASNKFQTTKTHTQEKDVCSPLMRLRDYSAIMLKVNRNSARYTDLVSTLKQRGRQKVRRVVKCTTILDDIGSSESEDEQMERTELLESLMYGDLKAEAFSAEYHYAIKLLRLIEACSPATSVLCLCALRQTRVKSSTVQQAISDKNGMQTLLNFITCEDLRCRLAALKLLKEMAEINKNAKLITLLGGVANLVDLLREDNYDLKLLGAEILSRVCHFNHARSKLRVHGGIDYLVCLLDISVGREKFERVQSGVKSTYEFKVGKAAACALWACSKSVRNRTCMREAGIIPILGRLLKANDSDFLVPVIGTLQECAGDRHYQIGIRTEGMVPGLIEHLRYGNKWLKVQCATTFYKCGTDEAVQSLIRKHMGLEPLYRLLKLSQDEQVIAFAATGAVWKAAISVENAIKLEKLGATEALIALVKSQPEDLDKFTKTGTAASERLSRLEKLENVLTNVCGALSELTKVKESRATLRKIGGLDILVKLLQTTCIPLLFNVNNAINRCAIDSQNMIIIERLGGLRLLVSLLKHTDPYIQSSAAWALCPCLENFPDSAATIRSFVGSLDIVVGLLESRDEEILTSGCALVAEIAKDPENLAVISDHGVVQVLSDLVRTTNDRLRCYVAEAVANCCDWDQNTRVFGEEGVVRHIAQFYLTSSDIRVQVSATRALFKLSCDPKNCVEMNRAGVLRRLIRSLGSNNETLQLAAVGTIGNVRRLALANEKSRLARHSLTHPAKRKGIN